MDKRIAKMEELQLIDRTAYAKAQEIQEQIYEAHDRCDYEKGAELMEDRRYWMYTHKTADRAWREIVRQIRKEKEAEEEDGWF